jgi:hypothetical protein
MALYIGLALSILVGGLALLLARETKLRRALQSLCSRLLNRLADVTGQQQPPYRPRARRSHSHRFSRR